ncbi:TPA: phosphohydrolase, partial [Streptococcus pyogenes]|nr:phosphohydrolase [Streptococcus pyogenes]
MASEDHILSDLASRFINRKILKSVTFDQDSQGELERLRQLVESVGFDPDYYTGIHINFDLPYDIYRPELENPRTQIEMIQKDGSLAELSQLSPIVKALTGTTYGDRRFYFPKEMLELDDLFAPSKETFMSYISNGHFHFSQ